MNQTNAEESMFKVFMLTIVLVFVVGMTSALLYVYTENSKPISHTQEATFTEMLEEEKGVEVVYEEQVVEDVESVEDAEEEVVVIEPEIIEIEEPESFDCGYDFMCLSEKALTCEPAHLTTTVSMRGGLTITSVIYHEVSGPRQGACGYYVEYLSNTVTYGPEIIESFREQGKTDQEIYDLEQQANQSQSAFDGAEANCVATNAGLSELFANTEMSVDPDDLAAMGCTGAIIDMNSGTFEINEDE
jgi:hypothetical protein